jgi:hypothetical protein
MERERMEKLVCFQRPFHHRRACMVSCWYSLSVSIKLVFSEGDKVEAAAPDYHEPPEKESEHTNVNIKRRLSYT